MTEVRYSFMSVGSISSSSPALNRVLAAVAGRPSVGVGLRGVSSVEGGQQPAGFTPTEETGFPAGLTQGERPASVRPLKPGEQRNGDGDSFEPNRAERGGVNAGAGGKAEKPNGEPLSDEELKQVEKLKARDQEVRVHEQAHVAAAGPHFRGGPNYEYQQGPDGNKYAVGGSVQIDTSPVPGDPSATILKAQQVRRAALAPAEPSSTDQAVAAKASQMEAQARKELAEEQLESGDLSGADPAGESPVTQAAAGSAAADGGKARPSGDAERRERAGGDADGAKSVAPTERAAAGIKAIAAKVYASAAAGPSQLASAGLGIFYG